MLCSGGSAHSCLGSQESIVRDWAMFVRLVSGKGSPRQKEEEHKQKHDNIKSNDRVGVTYKAHLRQKDC